MQNLPAYNKLYAWMHRISNAKLNDLEEGTEWWLYDSCDGPTCGPDRGTTTTVATTTANTTAAVAPDVSAACYEAQKALSAEENSLAKIPLQLACETACAGDARATCDPSETASAYGSPNTGFFSMRIQPKFLPGTSMSGSGLNMFHYFKKSSCHTSLKVLVY